MTAVEERAKWNRSLLDLSATCRGQTKEGNREMGKKPASRAEFVKFDVFYKDGSQRSNRKVPKPALTGIDDQDAVALAILEEQDRAIAAKSGIPVTAIERIRRSDRC
jgi:hypothetical protein